jgi:hypothetical protein
LAPILEDGELVGIIRLDGSTLREQRATRDRDPDPYPQ